jgi:hypothetical protein
VALLVVASAWQFGRRKEFRQFQTAPIANDSRLDSLTQRIAVLQQELDASERELKRLRAAGSLTTVVATLPSSSKTDDILELNRRLAEANQQIQQIQAALSGEQAKSTRLAQEFDQQALTIASLSRERRDAEANLAATKGQLAERDRQLKVLDGKVIQLERERDKLNDALSNQQRRVEHATRLVSLLSSPSVKFVSLAGTEAAPGATGYAVLVAGRNLMFAGSNLPPLRPGRVYQLWLMRGRSPGIASAGIFQGSGDQATIEFGDASLLNDVRGLAVTEEPGGGSPLPTGHKLLIGTTRS